MLSRAIYRYRRLTPDERAAAWEAFDTLTDAAVAARADGRESVEDINEYVAAVARQLGVKVWPTLLQHVRAAARHA